LDPSILIKINAKKGKQSATFKKLYFNQNQWQERHVGFVIMIRLLIRRRELLLNNSNDQGFVVVASNQCQEHHIGFVIII
jgi:hypothetical protein